MWWQFLALSLPDPEALARCAAALCACPVVLLVQAWVAMGSSRVMSSCQALPALLPSPTRDEHLHIEAPNQPSSTGLNLKFLSLWEAEQQTNIFSKPEVPRGAGLAALGAQGTAAQL